MTIDKEKIIEDLRFKNKVIELAVDSYFIEPNIITKMFLRLLGRPYTKEQVKNEMRHQNENYKRL